MNEQPHPATDAAGFLPGPIGLRLDEAFLPLTALHADADKLNKLVAFGQYHKTETTLTLRFAPDTVWHSGPIPKGDWRRVEISHGLTHLRLRGVEALHFLAHYTSANLHSTELRKAQAVRCKLNQYECAIWWTNTRDIHILTDRSLAQSFCDHLRSLSLRHSAGEHLNSPHPVAPDAPDRRG